MIKHAILATAAMIAAPAMAQQSTTTSPAPSATSQKGTTATATAPATSTQSTTATPAAPAGGTAQATASAPVPGETQVQSIVRTEFPVYDTDKNGTLDKTEFGAWMTALRTASDSTVKAGSPELTTWINGAQVTADADKNGTITQAELATYFSKSG